MESRKRLRLYWRLFRNFSAQPLYYVYLLRRSQAGRIRAALNAGELPIDFYPTKLNLRLLYRCNLRCKMCGQWGKTGSYHGYDAARLAKMLGPDVIEKVLDELIPHGLRLVDMEGGETLLYPDFADLLKRIHKRGVHVKFATNGTLLNRHAETIARAGVSSITVSLDGDRDTHNLIRGGTRVYDEVMEGLRTLAEVKRRSRGGMPFVQAAFTVTKHNGADAIERLCLDLDGKNLIDVLEIKLTPIYITKQANDEYLSLLGRYFGQEGSIRTPEGFRDDYRDFTNEGLKVAATVQRLGLRDFDFLIEPLPHIPFNQIPRLYSDYAWDLGRSPCPVPFDEPTIDADGNVYACNLFTDPPVSLGNVYESPFLNIWKGERFTTFRRMLVEQGGLLPVCTRCCQLTEY